jgi:hypothetical protein
MKPSITTALVLALPLQLGALLWSGPVVAQSTQDRIVGTWRLATADNVRPDGSRTAMFGATPKGVMMFTRDGHFALIQHRADLPKLGANSRDQGTPEENRAVVSGSISYYGTYTVDESSRTLTLKLDGSTYANLLEAGEQKRLVTVLSDDELRFTNPRTPSGATLEVGWIRVK